MNAASTVSARQKKVDRFLRAADLGTIAIIWMVVAEFIYGEEQVIEGPTWLFASASIALIAIIVSFVYMFARRRTDEYTLAMWHSGVTVAFFATMFWALFGGIVTGMVLGYLESHGEPAFDGADFIRRWLASILLLSFYAGFHFKRFTGAF